MSSLNGQLSTLKITPQLVEHIIKVLKDKSYGSVEIYIENYQVVQITERTITKVVANGTQSRNVLSQKNGNRPSA